MVNSTQAAKPSTRMQQAGEDQGETSDLVCHLKQYASDNPTTAALWCLGVGFFLGWKLRIW